MPGWSRGTPPAPGEAAAARQVATAVVAAAAPFAPTSYARARLLRQLYASGLLSAGEAEQAGRLLETAR